MAKPGVESGLDYIVAIRNLLLFFIFRNLPLIAFSLFDFRLCTSGCASGAGTSHRSNAIKARRCWYFFLCSNINHYLFLKLMSIQRKHMYLFENESH